MKIHIALLSCLVIAAGCSEPAPPSDPSVITSRSDAWERALNDRDIETLATLYTDDARVMPPGQPLSSGTQAVRDAFGAMIDAGITGTLTPVETRVSGAVGYSVGTYELQLGDGGTATGKYAETWERGSDGAWRISNDIWNADAPAERSGAEKSHLVILHDVENFDRWIAAWRGEDSRHDLFEANGAAHVHTMQNRDEPNRVGLIVSVTDRAALFDMIESEEGRAAAAEDGVVADTITVLDEVR